MFIAKEERNKKILKDVASGKTYRNIAKEYGISPERVRQIVHQKNLYLLKKEKCDGI